MNVLWACSGGGWMLGATGGWMGKGTFIAVFALLIVLLILLPQRFVGEDGGCSRWWRNARLWAILIVLVQIVLYAWWG